MEKVKEENRRKSEELEMLRRTMAQHSQSSSGRNESQPSQQSQQSQQSYQDYHMNEAPSTTTDSYEDYVMDFSKPAGYRPPPASASASASAAEPAVDERPHATPRRRSLQPEAASQGPNSRPPIPPPPRRSPVGDGTRAKNHPARGGLKTGDSEQERQRSQFLEEIRRSASKRIQRKAEEWERSETVMCREKQGKESTDKEAPEKGNAMNRDVIVNGKADESEVTKNQRRLKMSLNDEIRKKMQERLKVMNESDDENLSNVD